MRGGVFFRSIKIYNRIDRAIIVKNHNQKLFLKEIGKCALKSAKSFYSFWFFAFLVLNNSIGRAEDNVVLDELLTEIQKTLIRVSTSIEKDGLPPLNKITLKLKSALVTKADGKVSLFIVKLGAGVTNEAVQEINLELKPPKPSDAALVRSIEEYAGNRNNRGSQKCEQGFKKKTPAAPF